MDDPLYDPLGSPGIGVVERESSPLSGPVAAPEPPADVSTAVLPSNGLVPGRGMDPMRYIADSQPRGTLGCAP